MDGENIALSTPEILHVSWYAVPMCPGDTARTLQPCVCVQEYAITFPLMCGPHSCFLEIAYGQFVRDT